MNDQHFYFGNPDTQRFNDILTLLSRTNPSSACTSSLPLAQFWCPKYKSFTRKFISALPDVDFGNAQKCFEHPTPAESNSKILTESMTDLMILDTTCKNRIAIEAKFTEYVKDDGYNPSIDKWSRTAKNSYVKNIWFDYIKRHNCTTLKSLSSDLERKLPYQFLHRTASACFDPNMSPILVYQIFYEDYEKAKSFALLLRNCAENLKLINMKFLICFVKTEFRRPLTTLEIEQPSELFITLKRERIFSFKDIEIHDVPMSDAIRA